MKTTKIVFFYSMKSCFLIFFVKNSGIFVIFFVYRYINITVSHLVIHGIRLYNF